jgi:signal transduction histidine kinase
MCIRDSYTTGRSLGGSGLGLNIVYNLVTQRLDGQIKVESSPGQGTTFIITCPYTAPKPE